MDKEMIEYYHDNGLMPDWWYYQINGKSAEDNYNEQMAKIRAKLLKQYKESKEESRLEKEIEAKLEVTLEKALNDILKGFNS